MGVMMDFRFLIAPALFAGTMIGSYCLYPTNVLKLAHLFGISLNFGMTTYTTCIAGNIMFTTLPRAQFAEVQGKLFPIYFALQSICSLVVAFSMYQNSDNFNQKIIAYLSAFFCVLQTVIISPKTKTALDAFYKVRKEEGDESKSDKFKKVKGKFYMWHGISSLWNIGSFLLQSIHIYWLSSKFSI